MDILTKLYSSTAVKLAWYTCLPAAVIFQLRLPSKNDPSLSLRIAGERFLRGQSTEGGPQDEKKLTACYKSLTKRLTLLTRNARARSGSPMASSVYVENGKL